MSDAIEKAREFVEQEKIFRLGGLVTESSHPKSRLLSQTAQKDLAGAVRMLQLVDEDILPVAERVFEEDVYKKLVAALEGAIGRGSRIFFTGCGATGRLSILLEAAWRSFWQRYNGSKVEDLVVSVMAGGDFALIKSVEGFEDFPAFGRHQLKEAGVKAGDVVVAITEGGETPFVIGTAWEGLETGAEVFFVYNNPTEVLRGQVERSREVIDDDRICKIDLATGPMAVMGSTRMQAVTIELLVVGAALETALIKFLHSTGSGAEFSEQTGRDYYSLFDNLLKDLGSDASVRTLAELTEFEEGIYEKGGLVTYMADSFLLDVLTDTTERSPTFTLPPFRKNDDSVSPRSWAFVKNPFCSTEQSWHKLLGREPRGIDWDSNVYKNLNAPEALQKKAPALNNTEIYKFAIGNEQDVSRVEAADSALITAAVGGADDRLFKISEGIYEGYQKRAAIHIGNDLPEQGKGKVFNFNCKLQQSPLEIWRHLAVKLVLNTLSTATMARMGRVKGNAMVWVWPSNKKLIDRGVRLISELTGEDYEQSCILLFKAMEKVDTLLKEGKEAPSPVAMAVEEVGLLDT